MRLCPVSKPIVRRECVVLGGGLAGLFVVRGLTEAGWSVLALVGDPGTQAASLKMESVLHRGCFYHHGNVQAAYDLNRAAQELVSATEQKDDLDSRGGIYRYATQESAQEFLSWAKDDLALESVRQLEGDQRLKAGRFFRGDRDTGLFFAVPEVPFDPAEMMNRLRDYAQADGAMFRRQEAHLVPSSQGRNDFLVETETELIDPYLTVLCVGARMNGVLAPLEAKLPIETRDSAVVVWPKGGYMKVPLFADRESGLTVVQHGPLTHPPDGALIIAGGFQGTSEAEIRDQLAELLPPEVWEDAGQERVVPCRKVERVQADGAPCFEPYVGAVDGYSGLYFALPGKGTFAHEAAQRLLSVVPARRNLNEDFETASAPGEEWTEPVFHTSESIGEEIDRLPFSNRNPKKA